MSFNANRENKIIAKLSKSTVALRKYLSNIIGNERGIAIWNCIENTMRITCVFNANSTSTKMQAVFCKLVFDAHERIQKVLSEDVQC